jgi:hypothetical protein
VSGDGREGHTAEDPNRDVEEEGEELVGEVKHLLLRLGELAQVAQVDRGQVPVAADRVGGEVLPEGLALLAMLREPVAGKGR